MNPQPPSSELPARLTEWSKEPSLIALKEDYDAAKQSHDSHVLNVRRWNDLNQVKGTAAPKKVKGRSSVQPKLIRRQAEWRYSALTEPFLSSSKVFKVNGITFEDVKGATQNELVLNYQFRTVLNRVKLIDDFVRTTVDEGSCVLRLGWCRETKSVTEEVPTFIHVQMQSEEESAALQEAAELKQKNPRGYEEQVSPELKAAVEYLENNGVPTVAVKDGVEKVTTEKVIKNHPTVDIINIENFYIDPSSNGNIDRAMYACMSFETCKADLVKEGRYRNLDIVDWQNAAPVSQPDHSTQTPTDFQFKDTSRKKVVAYEYWGYYDIYGNDELVPIVATWIGNVLIRMELNPFPDQKLPFVVIPYLPKKRELFGETDAELLEDNQAILGAVTRGMIDLLGRSANGQQGFAKGMLDPLNRRRFENGQDYEFNPNMPTNQGHITHTYPEIPNSALTMVNLQNQEAESLTGVKSFSGGMSGEAYGDVAAGIRGVLDAAAKREMSILRRLSMGMVQIGKKIIAMNQAFMSDKEVIRITNTEFVTISRDDLQGQYDLDVDISTAEVDNAQAQDLGFMLQTMGPNMDFSMTQLILSKIADLKRMPDLAEQIRNFKPTPDPMQEALKKAEVDKANAEVEEILSRIRLNDAKAAEAMANKDKKDLDYVEQESGANHAREIEKQRAQSTGNQDLAITKALVTPRKEGEAKPDIEAGVGYNEISSRKDDPRPDPIAFEPQPVLPPTYPQGFDQTQ